ncbi:O-antigen ligase family protein [Marinobacter sp. CHS3-4]|uniref:O-antigen ligase family protein n=1 Tax=Marinobacter sp. CHS3-4 TaxID=3045174 RepID=UPI0024B53173|nr:O-antigen ligase family protein [Marinobacter sp. CHS3-4]MDI9244473.1 O-antigen ligase family protein [Marinobacter sp. CHS3-4]
MPKSMRALIPDNVSVTPSSACFVALMAIALLSALFYGKVNAEYLGLAGLSLTGAFVIAVLTGRTRGFHKSTTPLIVMFVFWGWIGIATIYSPATFVSLGTFWSVAFLPCAAFATMLMLHDSRTETALKFSLFLIITAFVIYACIMFFVFDMTPRATFANKNNFAALQMPMAFFAATASITATRTAYKVIFLALTGLFVFSVGINGSRAVILCLAIGFAAIFAFLFINKWSKRWLATLATTIFLSLVLANFTGPSAIKETSEVFISPSSSDSGRFVIWEGSLELAKDTPWHGTGPGLFFLNYSKYRLDEDKSAAFYAHNDYLQFFIEAGWPAPFILLASLALLAVFSAQKIFHTDGSRIQRADLLTALMGLGAIAGHSLLSFNFFLPSLLLMMGVLFGLVIHRLEALDGQQNNAKLQRRLSLPTRIVLLVLASSPALFYFDIGRSGLYQKQAEAYRAEDQLTAAMESMDEASSASPGADYYHYSVAGLWFLKARQSEAPPNSAELEEALERLETAEDLNPLRPHPNMFRARILETFKLPQLEAGSSEHDRLAALIESEYMKSMEKNPFYLDARFYLARFLLKQNRIEEGLKTLEKGMGKPYLYSPLTVNYYRLTAEIRRISGDQAGYESLMEQLTTAVEKIRRKRRK